VTDPKTKALTKGSGFSFYMPYSENYSPLTKGNHMEIFMALMMMFFLFVGAVVALTYFAAKRTVKGTKKIASVTLNFVRR
jgi:acyl-CoA thioesterase